MEVRIIKRSNHKTQSEIYVTDTEYCSIVAFCLMSHISVNDFLKLCVWYVKQDPAKDGNDNQNS